MPPLAAATEPGPGAGLERWLAWQEGLHPAAMALGLERVREVAERLGLQQRLPFPVVTVAGTNGKGSVVALLEAVLRAAGRRTGAYTSPHLLRYTERLRLDGREADEAAWCRAFAAVEAARGGVPLTYFEFGTLAAAWLMREAGVAVGLLEVGLGGRLDAVNLWDPTVAVITTVGLDHQRWLGPDREAIGREKAGILRSGVPLVLGEPDPPRSVTEAAAALGCPVRRLGRDFRAEAAGTDRWRWHRKAWGEEGVVTLPRPGLEGPWQLDNAAVALEAAALLLGRPPAPEEAAAMARVRLPGRFQRLDREGLRLADVAHNPHAAAALARALDALPPAPTRAVLAMLEDKDPAGVAAALGARVACWHLAPLPGPRGLSAAALEARLTGAVPLARLCRHAGLEEALAAAHAAAGPRGRVLVLGSFLTVEAALRRRALWGAGEAAPGEDPPGGDSFGEDA